LNNALANKTFPVERLDTGKLLGGVMPVMPVDDVHIAFITSLVPPPSFVRLRTRPSLVLVMVAVFRAELHAAMITECVCYFAVRTDNT